jgi:hypothetical protein
MKIKSVCLAPIPGQTSGSYWTVVDCCRLTNAGTSALTEVIGRNQGPTKLDCIEIDIVALADGLRGNSRLKSLSLQVSRSLEDGNREVLVIAGALQENKGLVT